MPGFVHLHVHSSYSLLEGALTIARLAELAKSDRQPALALTDTDNLFGALEFSEKLSAASIQRLQSILPSRRGHRGPATVPLRSCRASCCSRHARAGTAASCGSIRARSSIPLPTSNRICGFPGLRTKRKASLR